MLVVFQSWHILSCYSMSFKEIFNKFDLAYMSSSGISGLSSVYFLISRALKSTVCLISGSFLGTCFSGYVACVTSRCMLNLSRFVLLFLVATWE